MTGDEHAKRLDVSSNAFWGSKNFVEPENGDGIDPYFHCVDRVYLGIEGCIKADAMLTAIFKAEEFSICRELCVSDALGLG